MVSWAWANFYHATMAEALTTLTHIQKEILITSQVAIKQ
jgi:hypothetical protein